ncbi:M23 family metallopeptidase [Mucilaginibacter sp. UC70_90]
MRIGLCALLLCLPLRHIQLNSGFGYRTHPVYGKRQFHNGVDLKARHDTVFAILDGVVGSTGYDDGFGLNIRIRHGNIQSLYGHLSAIMVHPLDSVKAGQSIGITGSTGLATGEHLHFAMTYCGRPVNPIKFLYELLIKNENEQKFQSPPDTAFGKADRGN